MDQMYWLLRKRASLAMARKSTSAEARLIHLDLAGRYSVKAASAGEIPQLATANRSAPAREAQMRVRSILGEI